MTGARRADCIEAPGAKTAKGYGRVGNRRAHRVAYEEAFGPVPEGLCVRHRCDNPGCVNPEHLEVGTVADNNRDTRIRGRHRAPRGEAHGQAKLRTADVARIRASRETGATLARTYGVAQSTISEIRSGKWRKAG